MRNQELLTLGMMLEAVGIVSGNELIVGYPLIGAGVLLSIVGVIKLKKAFRRLRIEVS